MSRTKPPVDTIRLVLHEAGYRCANPTCHTILTIDIHHMEYVSDGGSNKPENLLPLCPNCHSLHHKGDIPPESIRAWKMLLLTLNEGFDRKSVNLLLAFDKLTLTSSPASVYRALYVSGDGVLDCAPLIAAGFVVAELMLGLPNSYALQLTDQGKLFIEAWKKGDQAAAVNAGLIPGA